MSYLYLKKYEKQIYGCTSLRCGNCGISCPGFAAGGFESNTPRGRMKIARDVLEGKLELTEELGERIYLCNQCGYCQIRCSFNPVDVFFALKAELYKAGKAPQEVYTKAEACVKNHNMCLKPHEERMNCLPEKMRTPRKADVLFFLSCIPAYRRPESVQATAEILNAAKVKWTTLGEEEWCCGLPLVQYGLPEKAEEQLRHNVEAINKAAQNLGVTTMIASCPGSFQWFKRYPSRYGLTLNVKVLHTSQLFAELVREGKIRFKDWKTTCVYQDACQMGRWAKVYEEPREVLKAIPGVNLVEAESNRDLALCCGSIPWWCTPAPEGVYVEERHAELADKASRKRFKEFETSTNANMIVTNCTGCQRILSKMAGEINPKIEVQMLSEVLASKLITQ